MQQLILPWNDLDLVGSAHLPEGATQAVLMLHGFTGNRIEFTYLFAQLSRQLAAQQVASFRFDFPGCGESGGSFAQITLAQQIRVLHFLIAQLRARYPNLRLHVFGFSMGGLVAMHGLAQADAALAQQVASVCVLAPAFNLAQVVNEQSAPLGKALPQGGFDLLGIEVGTPLLNELEHFVPMAGLADFALPLHILHGTADVVVPISGSETLAQSIAGATFQAIDGADHVLGQIAHRQWLAQALLAWVDANRA